MTTSITSLSNTAYSYATSLIAPSDFLGNILLHVPYQDLLGVRLISKSHHHYIMQSTFSINRLFANNNIQHKQLLPLLSPESLNSVKQLNLEGKKWPPLDFTTLIARLPHLTHLNLSQCEQIGVKEIKKITMSCTNLKTLNLANTSVGFGGLAGLTHLTKLKSLKLDVTFVSGQELMGLTHLTSLEILSLRNRKVHPPQRNKFDLQGFMQLASFKNLRKLDFSKNEFETLTESTNVVPFRNLIVLNLSKNHLRDQGLNALLPLLEPCTNLQSLNLENTRLTHNVVAKLAHFSNLRHLNLAYNAILNNQGWKVFASFTKLEMLNLKGLRLNSQVLNPLTFPTSLKKLNLCGNSSLDLNAIKALACFKKLEALDISYTGMDDQDLNELASLKDLKILVIKCIQLKGQRLKDLTFLQTLNLTVEYFDSEGLKALASFSKIKTLNLKLHSLGSNSLLASDQEVKELASLTNLNVLALNNTAMNNTKMEILTTLKNPQSIKLMGGFVGQSWDFEDVADFG